MMQKHGIYPAKSSTDFHAHMESNDRAYPLELKKPVICIVGSTASGKTALAQHIAERNEGEILSADSMQIYKGMDIGTGKIPVCKRTVPYWGLDLCNPGDPYSAALFQRYARGVLIDVDARGKRSVLCGGTGLYVRAVIDDYDFVAGEQAENPTREKYTRYAAEQGNEALWALLNEKDPRSAALIHPNNVRRVVRAFEMIAEGRSYFQQNENLSSIAQLVPSVFIGLEVDPALLNERIDKRVDQMISAGLVDEVEQLLELGFREGITAPQAIGYKEIVAAIDGTITLEEAIMAIKTATHRYAKRQRTWFRKDDRIVWVDARELNFEEMANEVRMVVENKESARGNGKK